MTAETMRAIDAAEQGGALMPTAAANVRRWLGSAWYAEFHPEIEALVRAADWRGINDRFWEIIPFGTGGRRGEVGVGPNRINLRTIGESAQGLADYIVEQGDASREAGCVVACDTRHHSTEYAVRTAEVLAAAGVKVFLFDGFRSTPELSFAVRYLKATAGAMITASHNPPSDNGFKAYWSDGGQVVPPQDANIIDRVTRVGEIRRMGLADAEARGLIVHVGAEIDEAYLAAVAALSLSPERDLPFVYTPLHGVGTTCVVPALARMGFTGLSVYEPQAFPDGDFPNVPGHKPNPEEPSVMEPAVAYAREIGAGLVLASDPDADRLAVAAADSSGKWHALTGNQVGVLLNHYVLDRLAERGELPQGGYVARTVVSTMMIDRIAEAYGVELVDHLLVGFKYIAETIRTMPPEKVFLFGFEESLGFLRGAFVRDKDATQPAVLVAELAARLRAQGKTLIDLLDSLYARHGYYREVQKSLTMTGAEGSRAIQRIMDALRKTPPDEIAGYPVVMVIDRRSGEAWDPASGARQPVPGTKGNVLIYVLSEDGETRVAIRPSGTEPKIKHYVATSGRLEDGFSSLAALRTMVDRKAKDILEDLLLIENALAE
jgi:phosphoglucomutase/phosphomannomutase